MTIRHKIRDFALKYSTFFEFFTKLHLSLAHCLKDDPWPFQMNCTYDLRKNRG
jgi:hypothetical protein